MLGFLRAEARWLSAGVLMTAASGFGQTYFVSLSNASLRNAFALSHGQIGFLYGAATLTSALALLEFGKLVDHASPRAAALASTVGLAIACLILAIAPSWWALLPAFLALRLFGQGMMSQVAMTATGRWFTRQRGRAVGVVSLGYPLSEVALPPLAVASIAALGWRETWVISAIVLAAVCAPALYALLGQDRAPTSNDDPEGAVDQGCAAWRRGDVLREASFWWMLCGVLSPAFIVTGLFFHHQQLIELKGWSAATFAFGFSWFAIVGMVAALAAGAAIDRWSARALLPVYLMPMAVGLYLPLFFSGVWVVFVLMTLLGVMAGAAATVMGAIWPELYGVRHLGEVRALSFSAMVAASAASPALMGALSDLGVALTVQLAGLGAYALLASGLMQIIQPRLTAIATGARPPNSAR
ncbi:MAG: MFS transporter [Pseudomonadota bacterium]